MDVLVSPLAAIDAVIARHRPSHMITLLGAEAMIATPAGIDPARHLKLAVNDIVVAGEGLVLPGEDHARAVVEFAGGWDCTAPMMIHCFAGISRSTAAAFIVMCALDPDRDETGIACELRAAAPFANPNAAIVGHGDRVLGRAGRMVAALDAMGAAVMAPSGQPFALRARRRAPAA